MSIEELSKERDELSNVVQQMEQFQLPNARLRIAYLSGQIDLLESQQTEQEIKPVGAENPPNKEKKK